MKIVLRAIFLSALLSPAAIALPLFQESDLQYLGAFRLPTGTQGGTPNYYGDQSGGGIAYDPNDGNLFVTSSGLGPVPVGKVSIPPLGVQDKNTPFSSLPIAQPVHAPIDLTEGTHTQTGANPAATNGFGGGGLLVIGNRLYQTLYAVYDGGCTQKSEVWSHSTNLDTPGHLGPYHIEDGIHPGGAGFTHGALNLVPPEWVGPLGGTVVSASAQTSIIGCQSFGPNATIWDHANFAPTIPGKAYAYYDGTHLGGGGAWFFEYSTPPYPWTEGNPPFWNGSFLGRGGGTLIPSGYRSYLHVGTIGTGFYEYGINVASNPPNPPVHSEIGGPGTGASTSADGLTVTLPNRDLTGVDYQNTHMHLCLSNQTTPVQNAQSNNAVRRGCSQIVGKGNSGTPTAFLKVKVPFTGNLTNQPYDAGKPHMYDPARGLGQQGNHAWPYVTMAYAYDLDDFIAVKNNTKKPYDVVPYAMWDLSSQMPTAALGKEGTVKGLSYDIANKRVFMEMDLGGGAYPSILVFRVGTPSGSTPCDVNKDGSSNVTDVQLEVNMATGGSSCTADINQDGVCNIVDVQRVVNAVLSGSCVSP